MKLTTLQKMQLALVTGQHVRTVERAYAGKSGEFAHARTARGAADLGLPPPPPREPKTDPQ